jgi:NAD(P)-dependent dehydrogenase (short-subunit alcohol dehydrogenase family)
VFGSAMQAAGRGSIVNIGSLYASISPIPSFYSHIPGFVKPPAYGASKAGVVQLTKWLARHLAPVRVNTLSPGGVRGEQDDEFLAKYSARVPLGRMAEPQDLVGPLLFLAGDASRYVTGQELLVDGGFTA